MLVATSKRHVLFLQGPGSMFLYRFGQVLKRAGVHVSKIHVCAGDLLYWPSSDVVVFRDKFEEWGAFVERYIISHGVSDLVLFSDSRPYHRVATKIAKGLGLNTFVFENGYFRPDWLTFERGGVNGRSPFPRDRAAIERLAAAAPDPDVQETSLKYKRHMLFGDWTWHGLNFLGTPLFPHYRRHRPAHPLHELWGAAKKVTVLYGKHLRSKARFKAVLDSARPYFFFPLQLDQDYQVLVDSPFAGISEASDVVIGSFAQHAPKDCLLLVKNHPHDSNLVDRERDTIRIAQRHGVADRVVFIETGNNPQIMRHARGLVTINSTMGTSGLWHGVPVCVLGRAVYDIEGLTHQGDLDSFWQQPTPPEAEFFRTFRRALIHAAQVRGMFGAGEARELVFDECLFRVLKTPYRTAGLTLSVAGESSLRDFSSGSIDADLAPAASSRQAV